MAIAEAFLSASVQFLFDKLAAELGKVYGVKDELAKLQGTLKRLRAMLHDAEQMKMEGESFRQWLQDLKNAARDAEDVVDGFDYEHLRRKVQSSSESSGGASKLPLLSTLRKVRQLCSCLSPQEILFRHDMAHKIDGIRRRLEEISKDNKDLAIVGMPNIVGMSQPESKRQMGETSSLLVDPVVFGRENERNMLIGLLLGKVEGGSSSSYIGHPTGLSVVSIVGMGGLGKTTLAQWVYNSKEVQENFPLRMWVHVSPDFDLKKVTRQILEHVIAGPIGGLQDIDNFNVLQQRLVKELKGEKLEGEKGEKLEGRRFLVVLDDVWEEDRTKWQQFCAPLTQGEKGSKVLITTRNAKVADMVLSVKIELGALSVSDAWLFFQRHAFPGGNSDKYPQLEEIGKQIVNKLGGIPLALTTIGGVLRSELNDRKWRNVVENELWELEKGTKDIFPVLKLSYEYLPPHLKQCFAYCSIFPKGAGFDVLELVQFWMAQGYISPQGKKPIEEVGIDCFNELLSRSFLQFINGKFVIHDLLHDLGRLILHHDSCEINLLQSREIPEDSDFRSHLILCCEKILMLDLEVVHKFNRLCTFMLVDFSWWHFREVSQAPVDFLGAMKCLRVLDLRYCGIENLPESIEALIHLRYLNLTGTPIKSLPESLCTLYMLQTLRLKECYQLNLLPEGMSNLISLHYLEANPELVSSISGIGKLTRLQHLEVFSVSEENTNKIGELEDMNELRGRLCIRNLDRVGTREDAFKAKLKKKLHLEVLQLVWADGRDVDQIDKKVEESIIEGLQPPPHLKGLFVGCYAGVNFPSWMSSSSISSLEYFHLDQCINLNPLPPFQHLCCLQTLIITMCPHIKELPHLPTKLMNLTLGGVELTALPDNLHDLPLEQLVIRQIPGLTALPLLPATLKQLMVEGVGLEALPEFCQCHGVRTATSGAGDEYEGSGYTEPVLSLLTIRGCPRLTTLREGLLKHRLMHLQVLSIMDCQELIYWPEGEGFLATLHSLQGVLCIQGCPNLQALPAGSTLCPSLGRLVLISNPGLPNAPLFNQLHNLHSPSVHLEMDYPDLACCSDKALCHIMVVDSLKFKYEGLGASTTEREESPPAAPISLVYEKVPKFSKDRLEYYPIRQLCLVVRGRMRGQRPVVDEDDGATVCDSSARLLCMALGGGHPWTSSLQYLKINGIHEEGRSSSVPLICQPVHLTSLSYLRIRKCMEIRRLPTETLLRHFTALKKLVIRDCPELTLSSVEEGIQSIPSLKKLSISGCPKLLMPLLSPVSAVLTRPLPTRLPLLQRLHIDDTKILALLQVDNDDVGLLFRDHLLTSLRCLRVAEFDGTCLTAEEEKGLTALAPCLQCLEFMDCQDLQTLPAGLGALLPNLKVLHIGDCPEVQCFPDRGLPAFLEVVFIDQCPKLVERCRPPQPATPPSMRGVEEGRDWHLVAHVPVVQIYGHFVRGSHSRFMELKAKWDFEY